MLRIRQLLLLYPLCPLHDALPILRHLLLLDPQLGPLLELDHAGGPFLPEAR